MVTTVILLTESEPRLAGSEQVKRRPGPWLYTRVVGEPAFWMRNPLPGEIDGFDPLTGMIIANSPEERERIDAKAEGRAP